MTEEGCDEEGPPDEDANEQRFIDAIARGPAVEGDVLVFSDDGVRLTYRRTVDHSPQDLFVVLADETQAADPDEIYLEPEGAAHLDLQLARLHHPSTAARFYVGADHDAVCLTISTDSNAGTVCRQTRHAALGAFVHELGSREGQTGIRAALIPDAFVDAATAQLSAIGIASGNLVVDADAAPGDYVVTNDAGDTYVITVPGH